MSVSISGEGSVTGIDQGLNISGIVTATSFVGSGANLTGIAATTNVRTNSLVVSGVSTISTLNVENASVGIGTNNPSQLLDVYNGNISLYAPSSGRSIRVRTNNGTIGELAQIDGDGTLRLYTNETTPILRTQISSYGNTYINSSGGSVGIWTSSPGTKLDVVGGTIRSIVNGGTPILYLNNGTSQHSIQNNSGVLGFYNDGTNVVNVTNPGLFQFNSGYGSVATSYGVRAWVRKNSGHDGLGNAIMGSGNVTSLTFQSTGRWTVNLTNAMPDTNYAVDGMPFRNNSDAFINEDYSIRSTTTFTVKLKNYNNGDYDFGFSAAVIR